MSGEGIERESPPDEQREPAPKGKGRDTAAIVEIALAAAAFALIMSGEGLRALLFACVRTMVSGAASGIALAAADPPTLLTAGVVLAKGAVMLAPAIRMMALSPRRRLAWIPAGLLLWVLIYANALPGITGVLMWVLFVAASVAAWLCVKRPALRVLAFLPWVVALEPLLSHSPLGDAVWPPSRLSPRCAENDGQRPIDFRPELAGTRYYSVTPVSPELALLTGESRSFWVRRGAEGATLGPDVRLWGNLWQGCVRDGAVWMTARGRVCEAVIPEGPEPAIQPSCFDVPGPPEAGLELDYVDVLCSADRESVYVTQLLRGGFIEFDPIARSSKWHPVMPGFNLQGVTRKDGMLVGITMSRLFVFDPKADRVLEDHPSGIVAMGIDICRSDDAVAVADFTGRVRLFERAPGGEYRFKGGVLVPAARRIAFSPSCDRIAVTSGDDRHAYLLQRSDLRVIREWKLGPGLRDIVFADEKTVAAADACTVSFLDAAMADGAR